MKLPLRLSSTNDGHGYKGGRFHNLAQAYGFAAICVLLAIWARLALDPLLGFQFPYATLFFAVLLSAWYGGIGPALAALVLGAFAASYYLLPPRGVWMIEALDQKIGMGVSAYGLRPPVASLSRTVMPRSYSMPAIPSS